MRTPVSYNPLQYACHSKKILNLTVYTLHIQFLFGQCSFLCSRSAGTMCNACVCVVVGSGEGCDVR